MSDKLKKKATEKAKKKKKEHPSKPVYGDIDSYANYGHDRNKKVKKKMTQKEAKKRNKIIRKVIKNRGVTRVSNDRFLGDLKTTSDENLLLLQARKKLLNKEKKKKGASSYRKGIMKDRIKDVDKDIIKNIESGKKY